MLLDSREKKSVEKRTRKKTQIKTINDSILDDDFRFSNGCALVICLVIVLQFLVHQSST